MELLGALDLEKFPPLKFEKFDLTFDNGRAKDNYPMDVYLYYGKGNFEMKKFSIQKKITSVG